MIYLATPYMHKSSKIRQERYLLAMEIQYKLIISGFTVYSPIVMCHPLAIKHKLPKDEKFWKAFDETFIIKSDVIIFAMIEGWMTSEGMKREFIYAEENKKVIMILHYNDKKISLTPAKNNPWKEEVKCLMETNHL